MMALLHLARWAAPRMRSAGSGEIVVTRNPAWRSARANFAGVADEPWQIAHQPRSAWSFLTELRPFDLRR